MVLFGECGEGLLNMGYGNFFVLIWNWCFSVCFGFI